MFSRPVVWYRIAFRISGLSREMAMAAIDALEDKKAEDIHVIDISEVSVIADYFIIAGGSNRSQMVGGTQQNVDPSRLSCFVLIWQSVTFSDRLSQSDGRPARFSSAIYPCVFIFLIFIFLTESVTAYRKKRSTPYTRPRI